MRLALLAFATLLSVSPAALAESFAFTVSSNGQTGHGTLFGTVDPFDSTAFDITSGTGTFGGFQLTLFTPSGDTHTVQSTAGANPYTYDNVLYTVGSSLDDAGLLFTVNGTSNFLNIYTSGDYLTSFGPDSTLNTSFLATFDVTQTPEPSSFALLGTGMFGIAVGMKRRLV